MSKLPVVALVGPPNAGKSTLFNSIIGKRLAVTSDVPGTTRDRSYAQTAWQSKEFILIDTGGLAQKSNDELEQSIRSQTQLALTEADLIVFVVDGKSPLAAATGVAKELKTELRKNKDLTKVPLMVLVNKVDSPKNIDEQTGVFTKLGFGQPITVSAASGRGVGDFLDAVTEKLPKTEVEIKDPPFATIAIVGRPNVGKSTLTNQIAGSERVVVSPVAGTTRAAVDTDIEYKGKKFTLIDTAGMRRRAKVHIDVEQYSLFQALRSMERADVVILLLDATGGPARFEQTIAGRLKEAAKGIVVAINKIDAIKDPKDLEEVERSVPLLYPFLKFAKIIPISANTGENVEEVLDAVIEAKESRNKMIDPEDLKKALKEWMAVHPPRKLRSQKMPRVYALEQVHTNPPVFALVVNDPKTIHFSYVRFLENQIRQKYGFTGTAIKIHTRKPMK